MGLKARAEEDFEITKHYASVLRMHYKWVSCYTKSDGTEIHYTRLGETKHRVLSGNAVRTAGKIIEENSKLKA